MSSNLFYILCLERGQWGNEAVWWGPDQRGYFADLNRAGKYSEDEAHRIATPDDIPIPCDVVEGNAHRSVHFDRVGGLKHYALKPRRIHSTTKPDSINPSREE